MPDAGETLAHLARALRQTPAHREASSKLREIVKLLHRLPPSRERDGLLAVAYLRLYQALGKEEDYLRGYSYARTARVEAVRLMAERMAGTSGGK